MSNFISLCTNVPIYSPGSFQYSGSLDVMDPARLNSFIEVGERLRIKSGILQSATFDVNVTTGRASGTCAGDVQGSDHRSLNRRTGSERGAFNRITSFITNAMKIRGTNMPDKSGSMKIGEVKYTRKPDDTFLQLVWFSLRSGVGDVIGF